MVRERFSKGSVQSPAQPSRPVAPLPERLLLKALLASEEARMQAIPQLRGLAALDRYVTKNILKALISMHEGGIWLRFSDLEGRLGEADRDLLSAVIFADDKVGEEKAVQVAMDCLDKLKACEPQLELAALREKIRAAERAGNIQEAMRLSVLVTQMDQHRKQNRSAPGDAARSI